MKARVFREGLAWEGSGGGSIGKAEFGQKEDKRNSQQPPPDALLVLGIFAGEIDGGNV